LVAVAALDIRLTISRVQREDRVVVDLWLE
jgi:hypothetical protein